nr:hypothetical protein [Tanacetum cinerariifolium]GEY06927.1 hypothetical protein [Tanacetum cinerariifolium]
MTILSANNSVFRGFFEKQKLTGPNFIDWYRQLRIVLSIEDKSNYLEQPIPPALVALVGQHVAPKILTAHIAWIKGSKEIVGLMLMTMKPKIQQNLEDLHAHEMQLIRQSVSSYVLKMKGYIDNLERLGHPVTIGVGYLAELLKKKKNTALGVGGSSIFVIELNTILNKSWIYDIDYDTYICNTTHGLRASRKLKPGDLSLYVGNGQREAVQAIGLFLFMSPNSMLVVSNKRAKLDLDSALLWHYHLGHISKKRIEKLQHGGLLNSTDLSVYFVEQCARKVAPIRSPTGIEAGLGEHLAPMERPDKIPIEDQDGYVAWFANRVWRWRVVAPPPTHLIAIPILISSSGLIK